MWAYPVNFTPDDNGTLLVTFPDLPEAASVGTDEADALAQAVDGLLTGIELYIDTRRVVPLASAPRAGQHTIRLPLVPAAKVLLHNAMVETGKRPIDIANALNWPRSEMTRVLNLRLNTKLDRIDDAMAATGYHLSIAAER